MTQLYRTPVYRRYVAPRASCAYLFYVACVGTVLFLPFFMAYNEGSFWLKTSSYREQPRVLYEKKLVVRLDGLDADGAPSSVFYSTVKPLNALHQATYRPAVVRSTEDDGNLDGLVDAVTISVTLPVAPGETVLAATAAAFFDVRLRNRARLQMETMAYAHHSSPLPGSALYVDGDAVISQRTPLRTGVGYQQPYADAPLLDFSSPSHQHVSAREALFPAVVAAYRARNHTADYEPKYPVWTPTAGQPTAGDAAAPAATDFELTMVVRIPVGDVLYTPGVAELLKDAWAKYFAMLVVVVYLVDKVAGFAYSHQLVDADMVVDGSARAKAM